MNNLIEVINNDGGMMTIKQAIKEYRAQRNSFEECYEGDVLSGTLDDALSGLYQEYPEAWITICERVYALRSPANHRAPLLARHLARLWNMSNKTEGRVKFRDAYLALSIKDKHSVWDHLDLVSGKMVAN